MTAMPSSKLELAELIKLRWEAELEMIAKRDDGPTWQKAWRQKYRWDSRWEAAMLRELLGLRLAVDLPKVIKVADKQWRRAGFLRKARTPNPDDVRATIEAQANTAALQRGAVASYVALSTAEGEDSGQYTLDSLGIGETFAWAGPRDFPANTLAVRGSKVIQGMYGFHLDKLAKMVVEKTNPAQPKTIGQLTREIKAEWPRIARKDAARVARTESAFVWETTNWNAMALNGVQEVEWLIAHGPNIGPPNSYPVCEDCLRMAANSPYTMSDMQTIPPIHPHDRCTLVPRFNPDWLPPAEPWIGAAVKMETFEW
jgi:hypothetical protein